MHSHIMPSDQTYEHNDTRSNVLGGGGSQILLERGHLAGANS